MMLVGLLSSCGLGGNGRVIRSAAAPVGGGAAEVREHPAIDGPRQTLWMASSPNEALEQVAALGEDTQWCDRILWRADGEQVAFLINGVRLDLFALAGGRVDSLDLVEVDGYPGSREARNLTWDADGSIEFRDCARGTEECSEPKRVQAP